MSEKISKKVICHDVEGKTYEFDSTELQFRPSAYGILIRGNTILLSPQWDGYDFPGGGIEIHETVEDALIREFREETGLTVKPRQLIDCGTSFFYSDTLKKEFNAILVYYTVDWVDGELSTSNFDRYEKNYAKVAEWIAIDKIDSLKFLNPVDSPAIIRKALAALKEQ